MIVVTGAAGFIGSCLIRKLNDENFNHIVAVDAFGNKQKEKNLAGKKIMARVERNKLLQWLGENHEETEFIFHLGARTDTTEQDYEIFRTLNLDYSKMLWEKCAQFQIPLVYASSAATYGNGELGYSDDHRQCSNLQPLNPYGQSKHEFDTWALEQKQRPFFWAGLKFFNVFGPNEWHKGRMASVVYHAFMQIRSSGTMKLFRSHHPDFRDGHQQRDFIYVEDVSDVLYWLMHHRKDSGIYNLGTGKARTFQDLVSAVFSAMDLPEKVTFVDTPEDIRKNYQYFTQAAMNKLRDIGYDKPFTSLEEAVMTYVRDFLRQERYL